MRLVTFDEGKVGHDRGRRGVDRARRPQYAQRTSSATTSNGHREPHALGGVAPAPPIVPKKFIHTAGNFREHEEESKRVDWSHQIAPWIIFFQNVDAIVGPDEPVVYPEHLTEELDYELELAIVLKKAGKWFAPEEATDYIGGYVIFNDITARDIQRREMRSGVFSFCKAIDTFCPLGPWIVTPDEIPDPHDLAMELRVERRDAAEVALEPDVGDDPGDPQPLLGARLLRRRRPLDRHGLRRGRASSPTRPTLYLKPGDVIEAEIERIGVLRNPVVSWQDAHGEPAPARVRWSS